MCLKFETHELANIWDGVEQPITTIQTVTANHSALIQITAAAIGLFSSGNAEGGF